MVLTYTFAPSEAVALEPFGSISTLASAIQIKHNRKDYPKKIIFWGMWGRSSAVLEEIARTGFRSSSQPIEHPSESPLRWSAVLIAVVLWIGCFLLDASGWQSQLPGFFSFVALLLVFCAATATQSSMAFQGFVLREGHAVTEIELALFNLQILVGFLLVAMGIPVLLAYWLHCLAG